MYGLGLGFRGVRAFGLEGQGFGAGALVRLRAQGLKALYKVLMSWS